MFSRSQRAAPIVWQLGVPSGRYSIWLYLYGVNKDTLFRVQNDFVTPKLAYEQRALETMRSEAGPNPGAKARLELAAQEAFVDELRAFLEEVKQVAPLWNPDLDDGVIINFAPLWRLVPQHRAWQREVKATWDALCAETYNWSHLAMHLWPQRVVPKCTTDRSLAIAHELEDVFWVQNLTGVWQKRMPIDATGRYLEESLHSKTLERTVQELEEFWRARGRAVREQKSWWRALADGDHDDHPLALALWPKRVLSKSIFDVGLGQQIGIIAQRVSKRLLVRHPPRHTDSELAVLEVFFDRSDDSDAWRRLWEDFHSGAVDEEPLACPVYTQRVVERAQRDHTFAIKHDLARWFWLDRPDGLRRLKEPADEELLAIRERENTAVKAALRDLLEAPVVGLGNGRGRATGRQGNRG
jgi:hypothetical protein